MTRGPCKRKGASCSHLTPIKKVPCPAGSLWLDHFPFPGEIILNPLLEEKKAVSVSTIRAVRILRILLMYSYSSRILSISGIVSAEVENISSLGLGSCMFPLSKSLSILEISIGLVQYVTYQPQTSIDILFTRHENIRLSIKTQHLFIASFLHSNS